MKKLFLALSLIITLFLATHPVQAISIINRGLEEVHVNSVTVVGEKRIETSTSMPPIDDQVTREKWQNFSQKWSPNPMLKVGALHRERLTKRFNSYYHRLKNIHDRIGSRLTSLESSLGTSKLSEARSLWAQAGTKLAEAKALGEAALVSFQSLQANNLAAQREALFAARDQAKQAVDAYKETSQLLKDVVRELHQVLEENDP